MTLELAEAQPQVQVQGQSQEVAGDLKANANANANNGGVQQESNANVGPNGNGPELELHRACVEGQLDEVRAVLSRGLEQLEQLDMSTGCTPIVLAIRANHVEVVRELLTAGAIVPPPGLTNDPVMLSLLYPQPMYGLPMQFMGHHQPMSMPAEFYPQHGSYAPHQHQQQQHQQPHQQSQQQQQANLPPAEVAKTIPCRNFPNCKYGSACVFFHPRGQASFVPGQFNGGYEQPYPQHPQVYQQIPYFTPQQNGYQPQQQIQDPNDTQHQQQQQQQQQSISALPPIDGSVPVPTSENDPSSTTNGQHSFNDQSQPPLPTLPPPHELSTAPAPFVPYGMTSPTQPPFGMSPMSPPMMPMSPHDAAAAAAFYASSPPNGGMMMPPPMNGFVPRRQSINQGPGGYQGQGGKPFGGHGKKPSFSGGPRPWAGGAGGRGSGAPAWKDGNPPPCAFFAQGKCRNGELCKFPHLDQEGTDTRHPDVIRGLMAPAPPLARVPRLPRMGNFSQFDPTRQFVPRPQVNGELNEQVAAPVEDAAATATANESAPVAANGSETETKTETSKAQQPEKESTEKPVPAQAPVPQQNLTVNNQVNGNANANGNGNTAANGIGRSASQPGVHRFQANGFHSRSQSPASSNVSFHGNGHPRRGGRPFNAGMHNGNGNGHGNGNGNGQAGRSVSAGGNKQRVPNADEFPALGGGASGNTSPQEKSSAAFSKTAAQVLSAPAPPKPEAPAPAPAPAKQEESASTEDVVTMDDESDSDAVLISVSKAPTPAPAPAATEEKKTESATPAPASATAPATEAKRSGPISFASVASSVASAAGLTSAPAASNGSAPLEQAPVLP